MEVRHDVLGYFGHQKKDSSAVEQSNRIGNCFEVDWLTNKKRLAMDKINTDFSWHKILRIIEV